MTQTSLNHFIVGLHAKQKIEKKLISMGLDFFDLPLILNNIEINNNMLINSKELDKFKETSEKELNTALKICRSERNELGMQLILNQLAELHSYTNELDLSIKEVLECLKIIVKISAEEKIFNNTYFPLKFEADDELASIIILLK